MEITANIRTFLLQDDYIYLNFGDNIFVDYLDDEAGQEISTPYALIQSVDLAPSFTNDGKGTAKPLFQIDIWHENKSSCMGFARTIQDKLTTHAGVMGNMEIGVIFVRNKISRWDREQRKFSTRMDFEICTNNW